MALTFKEVAEILKIIDASDCDEVVLELEGVKLAVRRGLGGSPPVPATGNTSLTRGNSGALNTQPPGIATGTGRSEPQLEAGDIVVRAPMVGTVYRKPSPEEPPFVKEGAKVKNGDALCMIEVMKLYTTITAPQDGVVSEILFEDASGVEFDTPLFVIKTD